MKAVLSLGCAILLAPACLAPGHRGATQLKDDTGPALDAASFPDIKTIAGKNNDQPGYADGKTDHARFNFPEGLVLTKDGSALYVADGRNHALRKVNLADGMVTTVVGHPPGNGAPKPGKVDGVGTNAHLNMPRSLVLDAAGENLYLTDTNNFAIRKYSLSSQQVTTIAGGTPGTADGNGTHAQFSIQNGLWAGGMALDESDPAHPLMYIADSANQTIRLLDLGTGDVTTIAGVKRQRGWRDGAANQALFNKPNQLQLDGHGALYIGESDSPDIRKLDLGSMTVTTVAGKAQQDPANVCDDANPHFQPGVDPRLWQPAECDSTDAPVGTDARFRFPYGLALDDSGQFLYVVDAHNDEVRRIELTSTAVTTVAGVQAIVTNDHPKGSTDSTSSSPGTLSHPANVVFQSPNVLFVTDRSASCVRKITLP